MFVHDFSNFRFQFAGCVEKPCQIALVNDCAWIWVAHACRVLRSRGCIRMTESVDVYECVFLFRTRAQFNVYVCLRKTLQCRWRHTLSQFWRNCACRKNHVSTSVLNAKTAGSLINFLKKRVCLYIELIRLNLFDCRKLMICFLLQTQDARDTDFCFH